ncbi:glycine zipper 2TM domain-containing protein [Wolbachia endosymbiont of Nilaparvata lugens]|uniref:NAD(P)(+) transhydrogenase (Re/Si-specific) subunit beta n=1 Tax=Wolbachia endosymbiont of Nilaparvata lugens TaxID=357143 RepID=UPI00117FF558|nr:NAD(P)(+) transhydrogenase (Re/Si-specific) subunit beta [Wolbachia endosymbiont of Nilaparvata lugens]
MIPEQSIKNGVINLHNFRNNTIGELIDCLKTRDDIKEFAFEDDDTDHSIQSIQYRKGRNISNNMKLRCIGVGIGLVAGLVAGCCLGQETLALIGGSGVVLIAFAIVGALIGAGAGYVVGKCLDKIKVTNMQGERSC